MTTISIIILIIFCLLAFAITVSLIIAGLSIAPWVPIKNKDLKRVNRLADLQPSQIFYDLGCGDGRVCFYLAKQNPQANIIGVEIIFLLYLWAKLKARFLNYKNVEIKFGNAFKEDLSSADVIYTFALINSINHQLKNKFAKELKPGAKVISYIFSIKNWPGQTHIDKPNDKEASIFIYRP